MSRRVKSRGHQRLYNHLSGYLGLFASDTAQADITPTRGFWYTQMFTNRGNYTKVHHMENKSEAPNTLSRFVNEVGIPQQILTDNAKELKFGERKKICKKHYIIQQFTEPHSPWQNPAELAVGITKRMLRKLIKKTNTPVRLWDYCWSYVCELRTLTASRNVWLEGKTPFKKVHGYSPNVAEFVIHGWYDWIWYHNPSSSKKAI